MEPRRVMEKGIASYSLPDDVSLMAQNSFMLGRFETTPPGHHRQRQWRPAEWPDDSASNSCHIFQSTRSLEDNKKRFTCMVAN